MMTAVHNNCRIHDNKSGLSWFVFLENRDYRAAGAGMLFLWGNKQFAAASGHRYCCMDYEHKSFTSLILILVSLFGQEKNQ